MPFPQLDAFLTRHTGAYRIAFSGGADADREAVVRWIREFLDALRGEQMLVVTGGTEGGVPGAASAAAAERQLPILGVLPKRGRKYVAPEFAFAADTATPDVVSPDGRACCVAVPPLFGESTWGDAAPMFVTLADAIVAIGGSWGTCVELALALKVNESRLRRGEPPIAVLPVGWFPGVADHLMRSPWIVHELRRATFPDRDRLPASPEKSAEYLRDRMREPRYRSPDAPR